MNERRGVQARVIALIAALALVIGAVVLASTAQSLAAQEDEEEPVPALESELTAEELVEEEPVPGQIECYWISAEAITRETVDVLIIEGWARDSNGYGEILYSPACWSEESA